MEGQRKKGRKNNEELTGLHTRGKGKGGGELKGKGGKHSERKPKSGNGGGARNRRAPPERAKSREKKP